MKNLSEFIKENMIYESANYVFDFRELADLVDIIKEPVDDELEWIIHNIEDETELMQSDGLTFEIEASNENDAVRILSDAIDVLLKEEPKYFKKNPLHTNNQNIKKFLKQHKS